MDLFKSPLNVINIGLERFAEDLEDNNIDVLHLQWSPPAAGNPEIANLLSKLGT